MKDYIVSCDLEVSGVKQILIFFKLWASLFQKIKWSKFKRDQETIMYKRYKNDDFTFFDYNQTNY